jgi:leucyl-tRNA synthetase
VYDASKIIISSVNMPIQINGKLRELISIPINTKQDVVEKLAKNNEKISSLLANKKIIKVIYVQDKIINFIVKD